MNEYKRYLSVVAMLIFVFPVAVFASFDVNLHYGSIGPDVTALQEFLTQQHVYTGPISGNFYSLTLASVKKFQTAEGITPVSGYVGSITRGVINQILTAQVSDSEGNATATKPAVDLSQPQNQIPIPAPASPSALREVTLPNGAIVQINPDGSIASYISAPPSAPPAISSEDATVALSISFGQSSATTNSAYISWNTNIPTNSKVFLTPANSPNNAPQIITSASGYSTQHFVNIPDLIPDTQYSYIIEATNRTQAQKLNGVINTNALPSPPPPSPPTPPPLISLPDTNIQPIQLCYLDPTISITPWTLHEDGTAGYGKEARVASTSSAIFSPRNGFVEYVPWNTAKPLSHDRLYIKIDIVPQNCTWSIRMTSDTRVYAGENGDYFGIDYYDLNPPNPFIDWSTVENGGKINYGLIKFTIVGKSGLSYSTTTAVTMDLRTK